MTDWYIDSVSGNYKNKHVDFTFSRGIVEDRIKELDPNLDWYDKDYRVNGLLNGWMKEIVGDPKRLETKPK